MKKFCGSLRKHIIDFEKKKMLALTKQELEPHQNPIVYYICRKKILKKLSKSINYRRVKDHCHFTGKYRKALHSFTKWSSVGLQTKWLWVGIPLQHIVFII